MIAFVLSELGLDPAWLVGGEIAQLGGNAGAGEGWLVVEGDESDRTVERLRPEIGVVTNVELDHHSTFGSEAEVEAMFDGWLAEVPQVVRGWELEPVSFELALPGEHNRRNAATALAALELAGVERADAEPVLARFRGAGRRFELVGEAGGVTVVDDYAHHPSEIEATVAAARERTDGPRARALPAAPLLPHPPPRARARRGALDGRRGLRDRDLPRPRGAGRRASTASSSSTRSARGCVRAGRRPSRTARGSSRRGRGRATSS